MTEELEKFQFFVTSWSLEESITTDTQIGKIPVIHAGIFFDPVQCIHPDPELKPLEEALYQFLSSKGISVRSGARGWIANQKFEDAPEILMTIEQASLPLLQEALLSLAAPIKRKNNG